MKPPHYETDPKFKHDAKQKRLTVRHMRDRAAALHRDIMRQSEWINRSIKRLRESENEFQSLEVKIREMTR